MTLAFQESLKLKLPPWIVWKGWLEPVGIASKTADRHQRIH